LNDSLLKKGWINNIFKCLFYFILERLSVETEIGESISPDVLFTKISFLHRSFLFLCGIDPENRIGSTMSQDRANESHKSDQRNYPFQRRSFYKTCCQYESCKYSIYGSEQEIKASYIFFQKQFFEIHRTKPPYKSSYILIDPSIYSIILFVLRFYMFADVGSMFVLCLYYICIIFAVCLYSLYFPKGLQRNCKPP
jgi:hypothetical protein